MAPDSRTKVDHPDVATAQFSRASHAVDTTQMPTPTLQQRYLGLTHELRCMQCQNEAIADSPVSLAPDLRRTFLVLILFRICRIREWRKLFRRRYRL